MVIKNLVQYQEDLLLIIQSYIDRYKLLKPKNRLSWGFIKESPLLNPAKVLKEKGVRRAELFQENIINIIKKYTIDAQEPEDLAFEYKKKIRSIQTPENLSPADKENVKEQANSRLGELLITQVLELLRRDADASYKIEGTDSTELAMAIGWVTCEHLGFGYEKVNHIACEKFACSDDGAFESYMLNVMLELIMQQTNIFPVDENKQKAEEMQDYKIYPTTVVPGGP